MTTITTEFLPLFDQESHADQGRELSSILASAVDNLAKAREAESAATAAAEALNLATATKSKINSTRLDAEIAKAKLDQAERAEAVARLDADAHLSNADLAEACLPLARALTADHPKITTLATAGPLLRQPTGDEIPLLHVEQTSAASLSSSGGLEGELLLTLYRDRGLHRDLLTGESIRNAAGNSDDVRLLGEYGGADVLQMRIRDDLHSQQVSLRVMAWPELPMVSAEPDPQSLAGGIADGFAQWLADNWSVQLNAGAQGQITSQRTSDGVLSRRVLVTLSLSTNANPAFVLEALRSYLNQWVGPTNSLGRVLTATLTNSGQLGAGESQWGGRSILNDLQIELQTVAAA